MTGTATERRIALTPAQREELRLLTRARGITPRTRDRLEMVRLADAGWGVGRIARHLGCHEKTVRKYLRAFLAQGFDGLPDRPHPGRPPTVTEEHLRGLEATAAAGDWTRRQLADWLAREFGVSVTPYHVSRLLRQRREQAGRGGDAPPLLRPDRPRLPLTPAQRKSA